MSNKIMKSPTAAEWAEMDDHARQSWWDAAKPAARQELESRLNQPAGPISPERWLAADEGEKTQWWVRATAEQQQTLLGEVETSKRARLAKVAMLWARVLDVLAVVCVLGAGAWLWLAFTGGFGVSVWIGTLTCLLGTVCWGAAGAALRCLAELVRR